MKIKKRNGRMLIVSLVVFVLLILSGLDVYANPRAMDAPTLVSPQPDGEDAEDTDSGYLDIGYVSHSIYDGSSILAVNAQLGGAATDSSYDLRSLDQVTPVRNQYSGGTCWAFAAICSAESSALKEGLKSSNMSTDLSELQIAYFMYHTVSDPLGNFGTDGVYFGDGQDYEYFDFGGNDIYVSMALAKWTGVTEELSAMPYPATYGVDPNSDYDNQYAYSKDALHLENALWIDIGDKEAIQSNIVNYGAATISFFYSSTYLNTAVGKKGAYYYNGTTYGNNHAVAIVG